MEHENLMDRKHTQQQPQATSWQDILNLNVNVYQSKEGSQLQGFLEGLVKREVPHYLFDGAREITVLDDIPIANIEHSLSLLVYAGLNPSTVSLGSNFESVLPGVNQHANLLKHVSAFFKGNTLTTPKNSAIDAQFKSFDDWTSVNEVKHISLWLLAALRSLHGHSLQSSLEVEIPLPGERRPGRLDVIAKNRHNIICFEAKTSISDAVKDLRFIEQVPKYKTEITNTAIKLGLKVPDPLIFLAVGGNEKDIKCRDYTVNVSPTGVKLLDLCATNGIKFVTAGAVWQAVAIKLVSPSANFDFESLLIELSQNDSYVGLLSSGLITTDANIIPPSLL